MKNVEEMNWQQIIKINKKSLESLLLLQSYGYYAGNNHGFIIKSDKFQAETSTELMNKILDICAQRLAPYKSSTRYNNVNVLISASGTGIYIEYKNDIEIRLNDGSI